MVRLHGSFLIRWWQLDRGGVRLELEHIQSGDRTVAGSLGEAMAWIGERVEIGEPEAGQRDQKGGGSTGPTNH